jgi:hypothetical protein
MSEEIKDAKHAADLYFSLVNQIGSKPKISNGKWEVCFNCQAVTHHSIAENQNHGLDCLTHYVCDTCGIGGFDT